MLRKSFAMYPTLRFLLEATVLVVALTAQQADAARVGRDLKAHVALNEEISFLKKQTVKIPPGEEIRFCFRNRVNCIDYAYVVKPEHIGGDADSIVAFVALREDLEGLVVDSVCRASECSRKDIDVSDDAKYCVVLKNADSTTPEFKDAGSKEVEVVVEITGCPTASQIAIFIAVPLAVVFAILACIAFWWIKRRRKAQSKDQQVHPTQTSVPKEPQMIMNPIHQPLEYAGPARAMVTATPYVPPAGKTGQADGYPVHFPRV